MRDEPAWSRQATRGEDTPSKRPSRHPCACGCHRNAAAFHHAVYRQHLNGASDRDRRNLVPLAFSCHMSHHNRSKVLPLRALPDSVFEFAVEAMGAAAAYEYMTRYYAGRDPRVDALLERAA